MSTFLPENDGVDHINIYSKGNTAIGQWMSNFADAPFICPDGAFRSIEGYWYWLRSSHPDRDQLMNLHGYEAKRVGRIMTDNESRRNPGGFQKSILIAILNKVKQTEELLKLLAESELPFDHYYVYSGDRIDGRSYEWLIDGIEKMRVWARTEYIPEFNKDQAERHVLYGGEVVLLYDDDSHQYRLESTGELVTSTTSITRIVNKPGLIPWAVKETTNWLRDHVDPTLYYDKVQWEAMLQTAEKARNVTLEKAGDIGHIVHEWIEKFIKVKISVLGGTEDNPSLYPELPDNDEAESAIIAFTKWWKNHDVIPIHTERKVYSRKYNYSGTFDFLAYVDGRLAMVDWKSSKRIWPEYYLQLAAYVFAYEEEKKYVAFDIFDEVPWEPIEVAIILRVPKDGRSFQAKEIVLLDEHFIGFQSCLTLTQWQKRTGPIFDKNRFKALERKGIRPSLIKEEDSEAFEAEILILTKYQHLEIARLNVWEQISIQDNYVPRQKGGKKKIAKDHDVSEASITKILKQDYTDVRRELGMISTEPSAADLMTGKT